MPQPNPIYVTGHRNPDTDSLASAHVLAWMHTKVYPDAPAVPVRLGEPNPQSQWLFESSGEPLPLLREDCRPQAGEACASVPSVSSETPLKTAMRILRESQAPLVVVRDVNQRVQGIISDRMPRISYLLSANIEDMLGTLLHWYHLVEHLPIEQANTVPLPCEPRRLRFFSDADELDEADVVICGPAIPDPQALLAKNPAAIIVFGPHPCPALSRQNQVPVYAYHGSAFALCTSLGGCIPCTSAMDPRFDTIHPEEVLSESGKRIADSSYGLLVMDDDGTLHGILTPQELAEAERPKVILVDHFERAQSIRGLEEAEIRGIVDHHRIGDIESTEPVEIDCRIWGSTASILYARWKELDFDLPASKARLLLGALISDTLLLQSPTTRDQDRRIARELAEIAGVDLDSFGYEVLRRNDRLLSEDAESLALADCKAFTHGEDQFLVSQIETVDLSALTDERTGELEKVLLTQLGPAAFGILMITDVLKQNSRLSVVTKDKRWLGKILPSENTVNGHAWFAENFVSRKKQLVPYILNQMKP